MAATILPRAGGTAAVDRGAMGRFEVTREIFTPSIHVNCLAVTRRIAMDTDALYPPTASMLADDAAAGRLVALDFDAPCLRTECK